MLVKRQNIAPMRKMKNGQRAAVVVVVVVVTVFKLISIRLEGIACDILED